MRELTDYEKDVHWKMYLEGLSELAAKEIILDSQDIVWQDAYEGVSPDVCAQHLLDIYY